MRARAILATLLYHGIRREELCTLKIRDIQSRQSVMHFKIKGKRDKIRFIPVHVMAQRLIEEYLALAGHAADTSGAVFRPVMNNHTGELGKPLDGSTVLKNIVRKYARKTGISAQVNGLCVHSLRATAATNALDNKADIAKVQEWLGHANISTTRLYDRRKLDRKTVRRFESGTDRIRRLVEILTTYIGENASRGADKNRTPLASDMRFRARSLAKILQEPPLRAQLAEHGLSAV